MVGQEDGKVLILEVVVEINEGQRRKTFTRYYVDRREDLRSAVCSSLRTTTTK